MELSSDNFISLGDRMKRNYEGVYRMYLPWRIPLIIRVDGKAFHSFTRGMDKPFDEAFMENMQSLSKFLCEETHTSVFAYVQSDEVSLLLNNYKKLDTCAHFGNNLQKLTSVTAGLASSFFSLAYGRTAVFDARAFVLPREEVTNYFIWRQRDCERNSLHMVAQSHYSHGQLEGKGKEELHDLIHEKNDNWNNYDADKKRGACVFRNKDGELKIDKKPPVFSSDREYIERHMIQEET